MSGIYIHIPFCKQACHYCDFHFSTQSKYRDRMVDAQVSEIELRKGFFESNTPLDTVYFGGGTPSILESSQIERIIGAAREVFGVKEGAEITLECNPDDINPDSARKWKNAGVNRLSIGIQSFFDEHLKWMNRSHTSKESRTAINTVHEAGFENINIDLIYGVPGLSPEQWEQNLKMATQHPIEHLSAYCLTIEPKTVFGHLAAKGDLVETPPETSADQFDVMVEYLAAQGILQYEVSNFARAGLESRHNTSYWKGEPYLGIGPSAHSFHKNQRSWNVSNNALYMQSIESGEVPETSEILDDHTVFNEGLMTGLRMLTGVNLKLLEDRTGIRLMDHYTAEVEKLVQRGLALMEDDFLKLTQSGLLQADLIASELFIIDP